MIEKYLITAFVCIAWVSLFSLLAPSLGEKGRDHLLYLGLPLIPLILAFFREKLERLALSGKGRLVDICSFGASLGLLKLSLFIGTPHALLIFLLLSLMQLRVLTTLKTNWRQRFYFLVLLSAIYMAASKLAHWLDPRINCNLIFGLGLPGIYLIHKLLSAEFTIREKALSSSRLTQSFLYFFLVFVFFFLTKEVPDGAGAAHHWSFYTGPAELVRGGGWLLHNVPSQYGFLNILLLSLLPGVDTFFNLHITLILLFLVSSVLFFKIWNTLFWSNAGRLLGTLIIIAILYFCPGWAPELRGPMPYPSVGPFRFIFAELLLTLVFLNFNAKEQKFSNQGSWIKWGHSLWLVGVFWSVESAIYCSCTWLPTYWLLSLTDHRKLKTSAQAVRFIRPVIAFLFIGSGISLFYKLRLEVWPDWSAFYEYALAYSHGFGELPINFKGVIWFVVFEFLALVLFLIGTFKNQRPTPRTSIALASFLLFWSTLSYFASRSHDNNVLNLLPIHLLCILVNIASISNPFQLKYRLQWALGLPFLLLPISILFSTPETLRNRTVQLVAALTRPFSKFPISEYPELPEKALKLLISAGFGPQDPITYVREHILVFPNSSVRVPKNWLPIAPYQQFIILTPARQAHYLKRWQEQFNLQGGLLLFNRNEIRNDQAPIFRQILDVGYRPINKWSHDDWVLLKYQSL